MKIGTFKDIDVEKSNHMILIYDCTNGNPNGDPDNENRPRQLLDGRLCVTDVSLKYDIKQRIFAECSNIDGNVEEGYDLLIKPGSVLNTIVDDEKKLFTQKDYTEAQIAAKAMKNICKKFADVRMFGCVLSNGNLTGPIQVSGAYSQDCADIDDRTITSQAVRTPEQFKKHSGTMGKKHVTPYALFVVHVAFSATNARKTGMTTKDLQIAILSMKNMFSQYKTSKGVREIQKLTVFQSNDHRACGSPELFKNCFEIVKKSNNIITNFEKITDYEKECNEMYPKGKHIEITAIKIVDQSRTQS